MGEGKIKYSDFLVATLDLKKVLEDEHIWGAFTFFDNNRDGAINAAELNLALERAGCDVNESELNEIFKAFDLNSDRNIDFNEFKGMMDWFIETPNLQAVSRVHLMYEESTLSKKYSREITKEQPKTQISFEGVRS